MIWYIFWGFLAGALVATIAYMIYDRIVQKEVTKIFHELEDEIERWKAEALGKDDDEG